MYKWWDKSIQLKGTAKRPIAFDTETNLIEGPLHIPTPALGMCYSGGEPYLIHPEDFSEFFYKHRSQHIVGHNLQFDFWVVHESIKQKPIKRILWDMGDRNLLHDTMILDQLIQLGSGRFRGKTGEGLSGENQRVTAANLGQLSKEAGSLQLNKEDPYRLRFGELVGLTKQQMQEHPEWEGFIKYAVDDVIATYAVYPYLYEKAVKLMIKAGYCPKKKTNYEILPTALEKYGPLSEYIQVRGSISLSHLSRQPLLIDLDKRKEYEKEIREAITQAIIYLENYTSNIFHRYGPNAKKYTPNSYKLSKKTGLPQFNDKTLKRVLAEEATRLNLPVFLSKGKTKAISTSTKDWLQYAGQSEFISRWVNLEKQAKTLQFLVELNYPCVYSNYDLLKKTGRTGASAHKGKKGQKTIPSINIQQIPRSERIRALFIPPPQKKLSSIDYGYIELRTLAATCRAKFGFSNLGEAIEEHFRTGLIDPHETMAAAIMGISSEEFLKLEKSIRKDKRQSGKVANFGLPGGLGVDKTKTYAKAQYNVSLSDEEVKKLKQTWLSTFPEMKLHLQDTTLQAVAYNLNISVDQVRKTFPLKSKWQDPLRDLKNGLYEGKSLSQELYAAIYGLLLNYRKDLLELLKDVKNWRKVHDELFLYRACTLTGRVRGRVGYCDGCNCPFQGLASDGGKEALWRLIYLGYDVRAFIHDAFICITEDESETKAIVKIMCDEMQKIIGHNIPVACDYSIGECWVK